MNYVIQINQTTALSLLFLAIAVIVGFGLISSVNAPSGVITVSAGTTGAQVQEVYVKALRNGDYSPMEISVKQGLPVRLHFSTEGNVGCGSVFMIYGLNVRALSQNGQENIVEFTPQQTGEFEYSCGMRMFGPGKFSVVP